jgi:hypothetical protein
MKLVIFALFFICITALSGCTTTSSVPQSKLKETPPIQATNDPVRLIIDTIDCEEGLLMTVESQILKYTSVLITKKDPTLKLTIACYWQQSPPGSTSWYPSWGYADLSIRIENLLAESTVFSDSFTGGAPSRGLAMKKATEIAVKKLIQSGLLPRK